MIRRISIEEVRKNLAEHIKEKLTLNDGSCYFEEEVSSCYLVSGQKMPCVSVCLQDGKPVFELCIVNVQNIEVGCDDLTVESLDRILDAIPVSEYNMYIWASERNMTGSNEVLVYQRQLAALPKVGEESVNLLNEVIQADWEWKGDTAYEAHLTSDKERWLTASFE